LRICDAPVGCTNENFTLNKVKGDSAPPRKLSPPRGLLRGVSPPPKKMVPFFRKKFHCKCTKYISTWTLDEFTQDASGQRAKTCESGIAHASSRIRPFPLATLPTGHLRKRTIPARIRPSKGKRRNNAAIVMKQALKLTNILNKLYLL
jgi:hypothetical protein